MQMQMPEVTTKKTDHTSCQEIITEILTRQMINIKMHNQLAVCFDYLNLQGYKRMHEYNYLKEVLSNRKTERYFVNHTNYLAIPKETAVKSMIPDGWEKYSRFDVTSSIKQKAVKDSFERYREWEAETKKVFSKYAEELRSLGELDIAEHVECLVKKVSKELYKLDRKIIELETVGYDMIYITQIQCDVHKRYKKKTAKLGFATK